MPYKNASAIVALMSLVLSLPALAADAVPNFVTDAVGFPNRAQWQIVRDVARKPDAVLRFSQIKPGMAVAELVPGDGYYTRILSKLIGPKGRLYAVVPMSDLAEDVVKRDNEEMIKREIGRAHV